MPGARFYFDIGSPYAWLSAERLVDSDAFEWVPVLLGGIFRAVGRSSWAETSARAEGIAEIERRAAALGLAPPHWPEPWPNNGLHAMRLVTAGRTREVALAAMRRQFVDGVALSDPAALQAFADEHGGLEITDEVKQELRARTDEAVALGVIGVPTFLVAGEPMWGDDRLDEALERVGAR